MENLTEINVGFCEKMEMIFLEEEGLGSNASSIKASLTSLKILAISRCSNLKAFLLRNCRTVSTDNTPSKCNKGMAYWCYGKKAMDTSTNSFFNQKVFLPSLESLILDTAGKFEKLWCGEIPHNQSYCKLEYLHVLYCGELRSVIHASMIERLHSLKQLWIKSCENLEVVFDLDVGWNNTKIKSKALMLPQLQEVELIKLMNLRHVMKRSCSFDDDEIVVGFPSLNRLWVFECSNLINLISTTTATTLLELNSLDITFCSELLEVIGGGGGEEVRERRYKRNAITFPHLTSLSLIYLDSLTCFSYESHRFDFTRLKVLKIDRCASLKKLIKPRSDGRLGSQDEDEGNSATQVLFSEKVQLPNLVELYISNSQVVEELWNEAPTTSSFCKLKVLEVSGCSSLQNLIPSFMVKRLQNLERLCILSDSHSLQDIFTTTNSTKQIQPMSHDQSTVVERQRIAEFESIGKSRSPTHERINNIAFTKLTFLKLGGNYNLSNIRLGSYSLVIPSLKKLVLYRINGAAVEEIMEKVHLPNLEELVLFSAEITELWRAEPPVGSFNKLNRLEVIQCEGLVKIIPFFMSKRLHNLEKLEVKYCDKLEIVCELKWLIDHVHDSESSKLPCFPFQKLASIHLERCKSVGSLFSIISDGLHNLDQYGETVDKDFDVKIVQLPQLTYLRLAYLPNFSHLLFQQVLQARQYTLEFPSLKEFFLIEAGAKEAVTNQVVFPEKIEIQESEKSSNFFGSTSSVVSEIVKALQQKNQVIIGLLGSMGEDMLKQLVGINLFDKVVHTNLETVNSIQTQLGDSLGIVFGEADVQGRAERIRKEMLTYIRNKRLLLILFIDQDEDLFEGIKDEDLFEGIKDEDIFEVAGIPPLDDGRVDPKHFKILLVSRDKELLLKMWAKPTIIPIGTYVEHRRMIFVEEVDEFLHKLFPRFQQQEELPSFDTNTDICTFFGPDTILLNNIIKAMLSCQNQIIGILGSTSYVRELLEPFRVLIHLVDERVEPDDNEVDTIQTKLETSLGIITRHENRAQGICQALISRSSEKKRLLLILRDLDREVDLEAVGIPPLHQVDPKFFKIILASEKSEVLQKMGAQQVLETGSHPSKQYFGFIRILDGFVEISDLSKLADECGSDYLAIILAKKLKVQGMHMWANAFRRLKESPFEYEGRRKVIASL